MKMRGTWRMLSVLAMLALLSFFMVIPVDAQNTSTTQAPSSGDVCAKCDAHATCYETPTRRFCDCHSFYSGNGYSCKFEMWRLVLYVIFSVLAFVCVFYLCLSCLGYSRRYQESTAYPMQPMGNAPYGYPPGPNQSTAYPAMYSYPPFNGYPPPADYPQTGYPVSGCPPPPAPPAPPVEHSSKVPGPSGSEGMDKAPGASTSHAGPAQ
nr:hypothetical protein PHYPA_008766 [Physcomitrium patens]